MKKFFLLLFFFFIKINLIFTVSKTNICYLKIDLRNLEVNNLKLINNELADIFIYYKGRAIKGEFIGSQIKFFFVEPYIDDEMHILIADSICLQNQDDFIASEKHVGNIVKGFYLKKGVRSKFYSLEAKRKKNTNGETVFFWDSIEKNNFYGEIPINTIFLCLNSDIIETLKINYWIDENDQIIIFPDIILKKSNFKELKNLILNAYFLSLDLNLLHKIEII